MPTWWPDGGSVTDEWGLGEGVCVERFKTIITLDDPKIELYHLWHPPAWGKNPMQGVEKGIHDSFVNNNHNWLDYVNKSKELYIRIKNTFINE